MRLVHCTERSAGTLASALRGLGLARGDATFVEADMSAIGSVVGGTRTVIDALTEVLGPRGLLMMPTFTADALLPPLPAGADEAARAHLESCVPGFDPALSPADLSGPLAEAFRTSSGVERSNHPVYSIAAWGAEAGEVVAQHPRDWAFGPDGPMGRLLEHRTPKMLMIGTPWSGSAGLSMAETLARHRRLRVIRFKDTARRPARWVHARDTVQDDGRLFEAVGAAFAKTGDLSEGPVGAATARLCRLDALLAFAAPTIAHRNLEDGTASPHARDVQSAQPERRPAAAPLPNRGVPATP